MNKNNYRYIIVDDDPFNNLICSMLIKRTLHGAGIRTFTLPEEALTFIQDNYGGGGSKHAILFLDINMPDINGWDFLARFKKFSKEVKNQITIYLLSSSINPKDRNKAKADKTVKEILMKPLFQETINSIAEN